MTTQDRSDETRGTTMSEHHFWTCPRCGNEYMSKDTRDFHAANDCAGEILDDCAICVPGQCPGPGCPGNYAG